MRIRSNPHRFQGLYVYIRVKVVIVDATIQMQLATAFDNLRLCIPVYIKYYSNILKFQQKKKEKKHCCNLLKLHYYIYNV